MDKVTWSELLQRAFSEQLSILEAEVCALNNSPMSQEFLELTCDLRIEAVKKRGQPLGLGSLDVHSAKAEVAIVSEGALSLLHDMAIRGERTAINCLRYLAASQIHGDVEISDKMRQIVIGFIIGKIRDKDMDGRRNKREKTTRRDRIIIELMNYGRDIHGLSVTRNDAAKREASAADYTARALSESRAYGVVTFQMCKDVWKDKTLRAWAHISQQARIDAAKRSEERELRAAAQATEPLSAISALGYRPERPDT